MTILIKTISDKVLELKQQLLEYSDLDERRSVLDAFLFSSHGVDPSDEEAYQPYVELYRSHGLAGVLEELGL